MQTDTISPVTLFYTMEDFVRLKENVTHKNNTNFYWGSLWLWSYGSWIYNYLCK